MKVIWELTYADSDVTTLSKIKNMPVLPPIGTDIKIDGVFGEYFVSDIIYYETHSVFIIGIYCDSPPYHEEDIDTLVYGHGWYEGHATEMMANDGKVRKPKE